MPNSIKLQNTTLTNRLVIWVRIICCIVWTFSGSKQTNCQYINNLLQDIYMKKKLIIGLLIYFSFMLFFNSMSISTFANIYWVHGFRISTVKSFTVLTQLNTSLFGKQQVGKKGLVISHLVKLKNIKSDVISKTKSVINNLSWIIQSMIKKC